MDQSVRKTPDKATEEEKKKRKRKKKTKQTITRAVTHLRLIEANPGKLDALDHLVVAYLALTQQYVTLFCEAETSPDKFAVPVFETELSDRLVSGRYAASSRDRQVLAHQSAERL